MNHIPYAMRIRDAAQYFGFAPATLYQWINTGRLVRGTHYLKVGKKICIIRESFIDFMKKEDGTDGGENKEK